MTDTKTATLQDLMAGLTIARIEEIVKMVTPYHCLKDPAVELPALMGAFAAIAPPPGLSRRFLEIGTWRGGTSAAMRLAFPDAEIWTLDLPNPDKSKFNPQSRGFTGLAHRELGIADGIKQLWMDSFNLGSLAGEVTFDLIFVDGDHSEEGCYRDLTLSAPLLTPEGVLVVHDYTEQGVDPEPRPHWTVWVERAVSRFAKEENWTKERLPGWLVKLSRGA